MRIAAIDINADVGEGIGNESELIPLLSSCNIACGGHAGSLETMSKCVKLALENHVKIGAHPSFPDKTNFGRKVMTMSYSTLFEVIKNQIDKLVHVIGNEQATLNHIKPHGALYNLASKDKVTANVIIDVIKSTPLPLKLYVPYGSVISELAIKEDIPIIYEVFADRVYNDDLSLVSRDQKDAVISNIDIMSNHVFEMIMTNKVTTLNGMKVAIKANTICIHGDNPRALELLKQLRENLINLGTKIL